jgi:hypothetical protein
MNFILLSAKQHLMDAAQTQTALLTMKAQLSMLGLTNHMCTRYMAGACRDSFMILYRTDHELQQVKRLAAAHKQDTITVLENVRALPEGTIAQGGLEFYTCPSDGYYSGAHDEQLIEFHRSRPEGDCTQLPACMGGLYITIKGN